MRRDIVQSVFHKELTELLRNRRSLMVMFGVPLVLYPVLIIAVASLTQSKQDAMTKRTATIALVNGSSARKLADFLSAGDSGAREIISPREADAMQLLKAGAVDAVIKAPDDFQDNAIAGKAVELSVDLDYSRETAKATEDKVKKILSEYDKWIVGRRLANQGVDVTLADPPKASYSDVATAQQSFGALISYALPVILLMTGMLGTFYPGLSATTTERELGTLETLLVTPATRFELLIAKAGVVLISGLLTAFLNMVSMSLVLWRVMSEAQKHDNAFSMDPIAMTLSFLACVPTMIFFTALVLMVGMLARNMREANAFGMPLIMMPIGSMLVGIANPAMTPALLITPVANTTLIIRAVLTHQATAGAFALAFLSSCLFAALMLSLTGRVFTNEQLVNPAWEPVSLRGLGRRRKGLPRWPAIDEVLALFAVSLLLNFYVAPSWLQAGLLPLLAGVEILLIAGPAFVFAWIGRYPWRDVFSLRRPTAAAIVGGLFLGLGLIPVANGLLWLQWRFHVLPYTDSDMEGMRQLMEPALHLHPWLTPILAGLLAGVCEELLFRGPIQAAFIKRMPVWVALSCGGILFAAAHVNLSGFPARMGLGIVLGWMTWRSGAIWPAMLAHAVYDGAQLGWAAYAGNLGSSDPSVDWRILLGGIVLCAVGAMLMATKVAMPGPSAAWRL